MTWPAEQFRVVKVFEEFDENPTLVVVRSEEELWKLNTALREFSAAQESEEDKVVENAPTDLVEYLETKGFTVPLSYSAYWPFDKRIDS